MAERPGLRSFPDSEVFTAAQAERREVVSKSIGDFSTIVDAVDQRGTPHYGLVLVDPATYPRGDRRTIGRMLKQLDTLLRDHPRDEVTGSATGSIDRGSPEGPHT